MIRKGRFPDFSLGMYFKKVFNISYVAELEGDISAEVEYLQHHPTPFSKPEIPSQKTVMDVYKAYFLSDKLVVNSSEFAKALRLKLPEKEIVFKPTGFSGAQFYYNKGVRMAAREFYQLEDKLVGIYSGGVNYPWQNLTDTILFMNELYKEKHNVRLMVAIFPQSDLAIATRILDEFDCHKICKLISVPHKQMNMVYSAVDFAILLRKKHLMNLHSCPGKLGEYLGSGLPVVITKNIGVYSEWLREQKFAFFIDDCFLEKHEFNLVSARFMHWLDEVQAEALRKEISNIASTNFSMGNQNRGLDNWIDGVVE